MATPKLEITFELDTTGTSFSIANKNDEISAVLQNLSSWIGILQKYSLRSKSEALIFENMSSEMRQAVLRHIDEEIKLAQQIFNNFRVVGTMADGKQFVFTHKDPECQETLEFK